MIQMQDKLLKHKAMLYVSLEPLKVTSTGLGTYCIVKKNPHPGTNRVLLPIPPLLLWRDSIDSPKNVCFLFLAHPSKCSSIGTTLQLQRSKIGPSQMRQKIVKDPDSSNSEGGITSRDVSHKQVIIQNVFKRKKRKGHKTQETPMAPHE